VAWRETKKGRAVTGLLLFPFVLVMGVVCHEEGLGEEKEEAKLDGGRHELLVRVVGWTFWRRFRFGVCVW
jgi:hypothetical protein